MHRSEGPKNATKTDEVQVKCDCADGLVVNKITESIKYEISVELMNILDYSNYDYENNIL